MTKLYRWPDAAAVHRIISKERLYSEGEVRPSVRQRFVDEVQRVRWAYKLGEDSVRLPATHDVPEFQVFEIELKGNELSEPVLAVIDSAVPSPIVFELQRSRAGLHEVRPVAARKQPGRRRPRMSHYLWGDWCSGNERRAPLPPAVDLEGLYAQLLVALMPVDIRPGENLSEALERVALLRRLEGEIANLQRRLRLEPQFNRKMELRRHLRARQADLRALMDETAEGVTWRG